MLLGARPQPPSGAAGGGRHAYSNVLHELVYALMGFTGDVFVDSRPTGSSQQVLAPNKSTFRITSEASWISEADRAEIDEVLALGYHYAEIERFVSSYQQPLGEGSRQGAWQGLAMGIEGAPARGAVLIFVQRTHRRWPMTYRLGRSSKRCMCTQCHAECHASPSSTISTECTTVLHASAFWLDGLDFAGATAQPMVCSCRAVRGVSSGSAAGGAAPPHG
jgi:hypothetical protein